MDESSVIADLNKCLTLCSDSPTYQSLKLKVTVWTKISHQTLLRPSQHLTHLFLFFISLLRETSEAKLIFKIPENIVKSLELWKSELCAIKESSIYVSSLNWFSLCCVSFVSFPVLLGKKMSSFFPLFCFFSCFIPLIQQLALPVCTRCIA